MDFFKDFFKRYYDNKTLYKLYAVLLFLFGCLLYELGEFGIFDKIFIKPVADSLTDIGKTIIAGGIISFFLKFIKFMGIVSSELTAIIYDSKYLENRKDLPLIWDRVTEVFFQNKFPAINALIREDIKRSYFPIGVNHYYEDTSEIYEIKMIDKVNKIIELKHTFKLNLIASVPSNSYTFKYSNDIAINGSHIPTSNFGFLTINGIEQSRDFFQPKRVQDEDGKEILQTKFSIELKENKDRYEIRFQSDRTYSLIDNDRIVINVSHIHHNYKVRVDFNGLSVEFLELGTIGKFKTPFSNDHFIEKKFDGLLYKNQGFLITLRED